MDPKMASKNVRKSGEARQGRQKCAQTLKGTILDLIWCDFGVILVSFWGYFGVILASVLKLLVLIWLHSSRKYIISQTLQFGATSSAQQPARSKQPAANNQP